MKTRRFWTIFCPQTCHRASVVITLLLVILCAGAEAWIAAPEKAWFGTHTLIPWGPHEIDLQTLPPAPPDPTRQHWLGTDAAGRDVLARLVYGLRLSFALSLGICLASFMIATLIAMLSALAPPWVDLCTQRFIELWSHLPFLYILMGLSSLVRGGVGLFLGAVVAFSWTQLCLLLRAQLLVARGSEATLAAKLFGFSTGRIAFVHLLPYLYPLFFSLMPFSLGATLSSLTALDMLGFGLPIEWPSWGQLLQEGLSHPRAPWLTWPVLFGMIAILTLTSLIGEASRKAWHPRQASEFR